MNAVFQNDPTEYLIAGEMFKPDDMVPSLNPILVSVYLLSP